MLSQIIETNYIQGNPQRKQRCESVEKLICGLHLLLDEDIEVTKIITKRDQRRTKTNKGEI